MSAIHETCQHITRESPGNDDERAAWTTLARAIFNLDKAVVKG